MKQVLDNAGQAVIVTDTSVLINFLHIEALAKFFERFAWVSGAKANSEQDVLNGRFECPTWHTSERIWSMSSNEGRPVPSVHENSVFGTGKW